MMDERDQRIYELEREVLALRGIIAELTMQMNNVLMFLKEMYRKP